jgi:putative SOS response-associated peptidase YedK
MPVALPQEDWAEWLSPDNHDAATLQALLQNVARPQLAEHPVSTLVNKVANNVPELLDPLDTGAVD